MSITCSAFSFATSCLYSASNDSISCDCKEGYFGALCQSCAAGYYGQPTVQGDYCKPCVCNNNINPSDANSCDSVTGECMTCLNNTFGESCQYCKPGFYGDAIVRKDCQGEQRTYKSFLLCQDYFFCTFLFFTICLYFIRLYL